MNHEAYKLKKEEILSKSNHPSECKLVLRLTLALLDDEGIYLTLDQQLALISHLCAMVDRGFDGGELPPIEKEMFSEVSQHSIQLAQKICEEIPNLGEGEKYLLSIHFESAKLNSGFDKNKGVD